MVTLARRFSSVATVGVLVGCNSIAGIEPGTPETDPTFIDPGTDLPPDPAGSPTASSAIATNATCPTNQKACSGVCASKADPLFGCDAAACSPCNLPNADAACSGAGCAIAQCKPGFADCNGDPRDGCEVDLSRASHCGACNTACGVTAPVCVAGPTGLACQTGCGTAKPTLCGKDCTSLDADPLNCGTCGNTCPVAPAGSRATCAAGACGVACLAGFHMCTGACSSNTSPSSCGASCTACPTVPNAVPTCNGVSCGLVCAAGFGDCDTLRTNGCETDMRTSALNCGACGKVCAAGTTCQAGACL